MTSNANVANNVPFISANSVAEPTRKDDRIPSPSKQTASPRAPKPASPSSSSAKDNTASIPRLQNGDAGSDDAQNESEAETVVLADAEQDEEKKEKRVIKTERSDGDDGTDSRMVKEVVTTRPPALNGRKDAAVDVKDIKTNGAKNSSEHDGKSSIPTSPSSRSTSRQEHERSPAEPSQSPSAHAAPSPSLPVSTRGRSSSTVEVESRKRKLHDESSPKHNIEPPRQRPKTDGPAKPFHGLRNQPTSPAIPGIKPHKRSASSQSALQAAQSRNRRELSTIVLPSQERKTWSDSSSEASSPRHVQMPNLPPHTRVKRSSHRALTSPARAMAHKKNVDRFGATRLARECEKGDLDTVKAAYNAAPDELNQEDFAGIAPLQKASLNGHADIVEFLIDQGCRTDCESNDRDTPLIDAVENGHLAVVKLLLTKAKVNPHHQNKKGQRAIDVLNDDEDDVKEIEKELKEAMLRENGTNNDDENNGPEATQQKTISRLLYNEYNTETLIERAGVGDIIAVGELINSNIKPNIACGVAAARGGHYDILSILLASGLKADPDPSKHSETPMLVAIGRGHLKIIELLLEQDHFDPTRRNREGRTYFEISEDRRGPKWEQERDILKNRYDKYRREHQSPKRNKKEAQCGGQIRAKRRSSPKRERSSSPVRSDARRTHLTKSSTVPAIHQKTRGRLISGRELSNQRDLKRRRRVVNDETSSSESEEERRPAKKVAHKPRSYSEGEEQKVVKKSIKPRSEDREPPRKSARAPSEDSEDDQRKPGKRLVTKSRVAEREKMRDIKPNPDDSPDDRKPPKKMTTKPRTGEREKSKDIKPPPEEGSGNEAKPKNTPTPGPEPKSIPVPLEPATTPEPVREARRLEAERIIEAKRRAAEAEEARKAAEAEAARKAAEAEAARRAAEAEAEAKAEAKRLAEEAEAARIAAEAEAKRLAEEQAEQAEQAKRAARLERISNLPKALKRAVELGSNRPLHFSGDEMGISANFLPLNFVHLQEIDSACETAQKQDPWLLSFQAVGVLGLPEQDLALLEEPYVTWPRKEATEKHRELFLRNYDIAQLAQDFRFQPEGSPDDYAEIQKCIQETRQQFLDMQGLYWIPYEAFLSAAKEVPTLKDLLKDLDIAKARLIHVKQEEKGGQSPENMVRPRKSFLDVVLGREPVAEGMELG